VETPEVAEDVGGGLVEENVLTAAHANSLAASEAATEALLSKLPVSGSEANRLLCLCDELVKVGCPHTHRTMIAPIREAFSGREFYQLLILLEPCW